MGAAEISLIPFCCVYLLLIVVMVVLKKAQVDKSKLLLWASFRMTVQLVIVGFVLTYILKNPRPSFTLIFLVAVTIFAILRIYNTQKDLNQRFKVVIAICLAGCSVSILGYLIIVVVGKNLLDPQYVIPLSGMVIGNTMTGITLGLRNFMEQLETQQRRIDTLLYLGVEPKRILHPFVNSALETALLPTMNSMLGMGIIFLPGMMTGQILSGTVPTTAIMYQIAIMISICASVCLGVFCTLNFGYKTLYNERNQISIDSKKEAA